MILEDKYKMHQEISKHLYEAYVKKNRAYGDSFSKTFKEFGNVSAITMLFHKCNRVMALSKESNILKNYEALEDSLMDLSNYSIMYLIELQQKYKYSDD